MNVRPLYVLPLLALAIAGSSCVTPQAYSLKPRQTGLSADRVELTSTMLKGYPFVETKINGTGPFLLIIDTGADGLALTNRAAEEAGLRMLNRSKFLLHGATGVVPAHIAEVDRLEANGFSIHGIAAAVFPDDANVYLERIFGHKMAGVLGMAAFTDVVLELDLENAHVAVARRGTTVYPAERGVSYQGITPFVNIEIAGRKVNGLIDTGALSYLVMPDLPSLPLSFPAIRMDGLGSAGIGKSLERVEWSQLAGTVALGPVSLTNPIVYSGSTALIGKQILAAWKLAFDHKAQTMYLLRGELETSWQLDPAPDLSTRTGFFGALEADGVRLTEVDPGCAFDLGGLRIGDLVLSVNGLPAITWASGEITADQTADDTLHLDLWVRRGESEFSTIVTVSRNAYE